MIRFESFTNDTAHITIVGAADMKDFKEMVQRGTNLWPDASPRIKAFADLITNGRVLQDYDSQNVDLRKKQVPKPAA